MYTSKKPYLYGTGRRKSSVARVRLFPNGTGAITINGRDIDDYFGLETLKLIVRQPLVTTGMENKVDIETTVSGGGVTGQAGAIRHGISRALLQVDASYRPALKAAGFLTRDPRMKERKKYGLNQSRPPRAAVQQALIRRFQTANPRKQQLSGVFLSKQFLLTKARKQVYYNYRYITVVIFKEGLVHAPENKGHCGDGRQCGYRSGPPKRL